MATFTIIGQDANNTAQADTLVVNSEVPITFTIDSGTENFVGDDPFTTGVDENEAADDTISYTDYDGNVYTDVTFIVTYEGYSNWRKGEAEAAPEYTTHIAVIQITSGPESGQTYTLLLDNPPLPTAPNPNQGSAFNTFTNGNHRSTPNEDGVFCFASGTMIRTIDGDVAIEALRVGDCVATVNNGNQEIRWIGKVTAKTKGKFAPVRISAGAFGENLPAQDLLVSPAHRMMLSGWRAELLFDLPEVLVPASALINDSTITFARENPTVEYFHIMFDNHEIVISNGVPSESFNPTQDAIGNLSPESRDELLALFPELCQSNATYDSALPTLSSAEALVLAKLN